MNTQPIIKIKEPEPDLRIIFTSDKAENVGTLEWNDGKFVFTGKAEESAQVFFDHMINISHHAYVELQQENERLKKENEILKPILDKVICMERK